MNLPKPGKIQMRIWQVCVIKKIVERFLYIYVFLDFVEFTDEEGYGKYLDLHECYEKYINLKGIEVRSL